MLNSNPASKLLNEKVLKHVDHDTILIKRYKPKEHNIPWRKTQKTSHYCKFCKEGFIVINVIDDEKMKKENNQINER